MTNQVTDSNKDSNQVQENKYTKTILLPQTDFPMRGNGPVREPEFQKTWYEQKVYEKSLALKEKNGAEMFILHDGPPYLSSDKIHIGTALNKILKDIVIKYKSQRGFRTPYIPGYDSHGLPIENAVVNGIKGGRQAVSIPELREKCKDFALQNLKGQEAKFKRLGVLGDWEHPYITLDPKFEAEQLRVFGEMAAKGYIYRGLKAVYWSYGAETALADAEVEYNEAHESQAIYVAFPFEEKSLSNTNKAISKFKFKDQLKTAKALIWTTTPWTIPANLAIALNKKIDYCIVKAIKENEKDGTTKEIGNFILAEKLIASVAKETNLKLEQVTETFKGAELEGAVFLHPLFGRESVIVFGDHVTTEAGTGSVHTAPGHGQEDFQVGKEYNLDILCPVDGRGIYTKDAGTYEFKTDILYKIAGSNESLKAKLENLGKPQKLDFMGLHTIKQGNDAIIAALIDAGALVKKSKLVHSYPYCWRSKTPLLYRATEQWFASVDGFRQKALDEIKRVEWIPERGMNRIYSMVEDRGDWCISRQRTWGVPIPAFYDKSQLNESGNPLAFLDQEIIEHVAKIFAEEGSSAWYTKEIKDLLPSHYLEGNPRKDSKHPQYNPEKLSREMDTMDVWFDSGSTHRAVVAARPELCPDGKFKPVDLYLEGSDQHRGWFQSSLLTSVATNGFAPYKAVLTHGFVMDEKGQKMSKSAGNVVDPEDVIQKYGADILRLWVASVDYSIDIKVGDNMFKQLSDIYRNFRNTCRYMLGSLYDFNPETDSLPYAELNELDKLILHRLQNLKEKLTESFDKYQFFKYYQLIQNFCSVDLSSFYFDIIKDRLYTNAANSKSRRAAQTVIYELLSALNRLFVPVVPHLAEDVLQHSPEQVKKSYLKKDFFTKGCTEKEFSVLLSSWPAIDTEFVNNQLEQDWNKILEIRELAFKEIELLRQNKVIGKSLEAEVTIHADPQTEKFLKSIQDEINAVFIVSNHQIISDTVNKVVAGKFAGVKCERCWKLFAESDMRGEICFSCQEALL